MRSARKKRLTTLQIAVLSSVSVAVSIVGVSVIDTDSKVSRPSDDLFRNSQTVPIL